MKTIHLLSACLPCFLIAPAQAKGLLGETYITGSFDSGSVEEVDAWGLSFGYNKPIAQDREYSYDFNLSAYFAELDEAGIDADGKGLEAGLVVFPNKEMEVRPFIAAHVGYGELAAFGLSDDSFLYRVSVGGEWQASERVVLTPTVSYFDYTELADGDDVTVGVSGSFWIDDHNNVGLGFERTSRSGLHADVVSVTYRFAY